LQRIELDDRVLLLAYAVGQGPESVPYQAAVQQAGEHLVVHICRPVSLTRD
jgi:hypothetical protein